VVEGGASMTFHKQWAVGEQDGFAPQLLEFLRSKKLVGKLASTFGGPDELLLQSGGPITIDSSQTLIAGPPTIRIISQQPSRIKQPESSMRGSALVGEVHLGEAQATCDWRIEEWSESGIWQPRVTVQRSDLSSALRSLNHLQPDLNNGEKGIQPGCFAGLLTYDLVQWTEPVRLHNLPPPSALLGILHRVDRWVIHDRDAGTLTLSTLHKDKWFHNCSEAIEEWLIGDIEESQSAVEKSGFDSTIDDEKHSSIVDTVRDSIRDGQFYQLNYGRIWSGELHDPWAVYKRLVKSNPAPYSGWLLVPDFDYVLASVSPELLLSSDGDEVSTRPIKGTRPRARTKDRDDVLKRELVTSLKEISEHMMLVDLERNDLGKVCSVGTVRWHDWRIESHPNVHHLVSDVRGKLRPELDGWDALQALFPGGSITGCPKTVTIAAIDELEGVSRRAWTGSLGFYDPRNGIACWNILIRTLEAEYSRGRWQAKVQAGGGLVFESNSLEEVEEAKWKAQALLDAAWGASASKVPSGDMSMELVPILSPETKALHASLNAVSQVCIAPAEPVEWLYSDPPLTQVCQGERRLLFVDNLDSFSWNIVHACSQLGAEVILINGRGGEKKLPIEEILRAVKPTHIIIGPGPGWPANSLLTQELAAKALAGDIFDLDGNKIPLLGICLGHQAIGEAAGWKLSPAPSGAVHGVTEEMLLQNNPLFSRMDDCQRMMRYHSLVLEPTNENLDIIATDISKTLIMGISHIDHPVWGVQFHPESCGSPEGWKMLENFLTVSFRVPSQSVEVPLAGRQV
jgi:anthranilate synthase/aminodeoxychorismate synthase-like glutamine amidotransferase